MADYDKEAREMSTSELRSALSWQETLSDHYDEIGGGRESAVVQRKREAIERELRARRREY